MKESMLYQLHSYGFDPDVKEPELLRRFHVREQHECLVYKIRALMRSPCLL